MTNFFYAIFFIGFRIIDWNRGQKALRTGRPGESDILFCYFFHILTSNTIPILL